jgi:hypothetical protein
MACKECLARLQASARFGRRKSPEAAFESHQASTIRPLGFDCEGWAPRYLRRRLSRSAVAATAGAINSLSATNSPSVAVAFSAQLRAARPPIVSAS